MQQPRGVKTLTTRHLLDDLPMRPLQMTAVALCVTLSALDGFDVLAISFAAPGIAEAWDISAAALGIVLSVELAGMAVGSLVIGRMADAFGRRPTILGCLVTMTCGMYLASIASSVESLLVVRFITGIGIGGMLATTNAMVAELSNTRRRSFNVALMATGYPIGIVTGGAVAAMLLAHFDWRSVFVLGAVMNGALIPVIWCLMPESIAYLAHKRPPDALIRINATLRRMGHAAIEALPAPNEDTTSGSWRNLFSPALVRITMLLTFAYLAHIMTFYYIIKWIPKLVADMHFSASSAGGVLVWANVGGALGSVVLGVLTHRFKVRQLVMAALTGSVVMICWFGQGQASLVELAVIAAVAGLFTNSAVVGLYAMFAQSFPTHLRASGTGFVIGVGRAGAVLGPVIAGYLFDAGIALPAVSLLMALGSLIALCLLVFFRERQNA